MVHIGQLVQEDVKEHTHAQAHYRLTCTVVFLVKTQCSLVCGYKHCKAACYLYLYLHSADEGSTTPDMLVTTYLNEHHNLTPSLHFLHTFP